MYFEDAILVACPAKMNDRGNHIRDCDATPGERCWNRGSMIPLNGFHMERQRAWNALTKRKRRALLVKARLEGKYNG